MSYFGTIISLLGTLIAICGVVIGVLWHFLKPLNEKIDTFKGELGELRTDISKLSTQFLSFGHRLDRDESRFNEFHGAMDRFNILLDQHIIEFSNFRIKSEARFENLQVDNRKLER